MLNKLINTLSRWRNSDSVTEKTTLSAKDKNKRFLIVILLVFAMLAGLMFLAEWVENESVVAESENVPYMLLEGAVFLISIAGVAWLVWQMFERQNELERAHQKLMDANEKLDATQERLEQLSEKYHEVIQQQYEDWALSPTEKEVASLLLKGLSFDEIAGIRETREKTVRQQASAIYRKAGLSGRHELAAWFFEDFV